MQDDKNKRMGKDIPIKYNEKENENYNSNAR